jgi:enamine deaminase RidA (YjgF/YER057c/UK114 family)
MEPVRHFVLDPPPHRCDVAEVGNIVYVAGMTAYDRQAPLDQQARETMTKIDIALQAAGTDKSKLVWANVWLADTADYDAFNEVWNAWIVPGKGPARACVRADLMLEGLKVEIAVVAAK